MAHEVTTFPGGLLVVPVDQALKDGLRKLCQKQLGSEGEGKAADVLTTLLAHPYLVHDQRIIAEQADRVARHNRDKCVLVGMKKRLSAGELAQQGLEDATAQAELTVAKLSKRAVRLLGIADNWLLMEVDRHPAGGSGDVRIQYWLYGKRQRTLRLLKYRATMGKKGTALFAVRSGGGVPGPPKQDLRRQFLALVERQLGSSMVKTFARLIQLQSRKLAHAPKEVAEEIEDITGINLTADEESCARDREARYAQEFGPRKARPFFTIDHQTIRLARERGEGGTSRPG